jgi:dCMP deaminase
MIIGLTGRNASGKGEAANFLKSKGFTFYSLSDVIREEVGRLGLEITRNNLIATGRDLRAKHGTAFLAEQILQRLASDQNYVIDSFRHPDEVNAFRQRPDFSLLFISAPVEIRFDRIKQRARENDPETMEEFLALEAAEATSHDVEGQNLTATEALADFVINNDSSIEALHQNLSQITQRILSEISRPSWDEYFMKIAQVAALRSNCVKRKVAAVIVRDKRVISTGYNGTPRGTKNCYEGGCPRCNNLADSGTKLDECLCSHGEENSITQAAYHGVSVKDATLYTTFAPCLMCTKMIINAGIREVVYNKDYPLNDSSFALLREAGVLCRQLEVDEDQ